MKWLLPVLFLSATLHSSASDGKWTPQQMREIDPAWLKAQGLELSATELWDPVRGTGLLAATVQTGGCTGGFISATGLFITNHHCLFGMLQQNSSVGRDLISDGYLARKQSDELSSKSAVLSVPRRFTDVTSAVLQSVPRGANDLQRFEAIETKEKALVAECEKQPATRCKVSRYDGGLQYILAEVTEFADVRLVYSPPRAVGEFGGEVDNWMWPRHTGDFAIGRVYVSPEGKPAPYDPANVPYTPEFHFPFSQKGVSPGDFVMVMGYPGVTYRSLTAAEMLERRDLFFTRRAEIYGEWIALLEKATAKDEAGAIAVADNLKTFLNRTKNAQGQLAGFREHHIIERKIEEEKAILDWASTRPQFRSGVAARAALAELIEEQRRTWEMDYLLGLVGPGTSTPVPVGPKSIFFAATAVRAASERPKKDELREPLYMEREAVKLASRMEREQKNLFLPADQALFTSFVRRALALPTGQRIAAVDEAFWNSSDVEADVRALYAGSRIFDLAERGKMLTETTAQLQARKDPLLTFGFALDRDLRVSFERRNRWEGAISRLRPEWRRLVIAHAGKAVAPDANSTLRVSFAHVQGYKPRDGVVYSPQTTVSGMVAKHTGAEPFDVPDAVLAAAERKSSAWTDANLGDVPVAFLADGDTTGGNSGSPVVNGRGELVGVNFDRVWENVANDFAFLPEVGRNISVDVRYVFWMLDQVAGATELLRELGVKR